MRLALVLALCGGCATGRPDKVAWPYAPASDPGPAEDVVGGRGGPGEPDALEADPDEPLAGELPTRRVVVDPALEHALRWPVPPVGVNSLFGERLDPVDGKPRFHAGVDLEAPYGSLVVAAAPGVVTSAGWARGHGRQVMVEHGGGLRTVYSHLAQIYAIPGTFVRAGDPLGQVGNSGRSTGPHLHFEVRRSGEALDPMGALEH